jgi:hypothetical protein
MWSMLSNIPGANAFHLVQTKSILDQMTNPAFKNTEEALKTYNDFWDLSVIENK